jgi:NAD(P)-dependent dehydrogenase (short-subunit alcohol dehydrogenase family)
MTAATPPILVTGATGRMGGTGRHVAAELLNRGLRVRAIVRRLDERSENLRVMGIEVVVGDFAKYTSLLAALDGIEAAYFCYPGGAGLTEAAGLSQPPDASGVCGASSICPWTRPFPTVPAHRDARVGSPNGSSSGPDTAAPI